MDEVLSAVGSQLSDIIVERSFDGLLVFDRSLRYVLWNRAMERLTGVPREQCLGRPAAEVFPFLEEIGQIRYLKAALMGLTVTVEERPFSVPETGRKGFFRARYSPLHDAAGTVVSYTVSPLPPSATSAYLPWKAAP